METALKILTTMLMSKFSSSEAGSKIMGLTNSAKTTDSLWKKFKPQTIGE